MHIFPEASSVDDNGGRWDDSAGWAGKPRLREEICARREGVFKSTITLGVEMKAYG